MKKILVVDDNEDILNIISIVLEMEGYYVTCANDGSMVNAKVQSELPDLILLDIMLAGMDGRDICKALKSDPQTSHIPIIMISASHTVLSTMEKCKADDFIAKPFDIHILAEKVGHYTN
jgi:DNA-binding response OmpR family regulator